MRKHFLILMLLALLPLAGWAQNTLDGATVTFDPANLIYDGTAQALPTGANTDVTKGGVDATDVIVVWRNANNEIVTTATNPGTYTYTITAGNFNGSISGSYQMAKRRVKVVATDKAINYGDDVPTFTGDGVWSYQTGVPNEGFLDADLQAGAPKAGIVTGTPTFTTNYVKGNPKSDAEHVYTIDPSVTGMSATNYDFGYVQGTLTVNAKAFVANDNTKFTIAADNDVYDGADYKPEPTVIDVVLNKTLVKTTDYTLTYHADNNGAPAAAEAAANALTNAGTYWVKATGKGNYSGNLSVSYKVTKKGLAISTGNRQTTYGIAYDAPAITFEGLIAADADANGTPIADAYKANGNTFGLKYKKGTAAATTIKPTAAGTYTVTAYAYKGDDELDADNVFVNYTPIYFNGGQVVIAKKEITFTLKAQSKAYGETHDVEAANGVLVSTAELATAYYQAVPEAYDVNTYAAATNMLANGDAITVTKQGRVKLNDAKTKVIATFGNDFEIKHGDNVVTSNYDVKYVEADFTTNKGTIYVRAQNAAIKFGDAAVTDFTIQVSGGEASDVATIQNALKNNVTIAQTGKHLDDTDGATYPNAGKYNLDFSSVDLGEELNAKYNVEKFVGTYTINKAYVNVNAKPQVHMVGEAVTAAASAETIELALITNTEDPNYANAGAVLPTGADLTAIYQALSLEYNNAALNTYVNGEGKLLATALEHGTAAADPVVNGIYYNGIVINATKVTNYNNANNNYSLVAAFAQLTVTSADILALDKDGATNSTTIEANKNLKKNVRISGRTLYENQWNALTLPFAVNPLEFCKSINGYAVFDVLQPSGNDMNFKITINEIPAYTPFLVKVNSEIALNDVTFDKVTIEEINETNLTQSNDAYNFVGTLDAKALEFELWTIQPNDPNGNIKALKRNAGWTVKAFNAYITAKEPNAPAPRIFVEEPDGSVTAIETINAEGVAMKAEGWYTVNGVKLQSAPTEKGIYINNGKKVVIK